MSSVYVADFETGISNNRDEAWVYMAGLKKVGEGDVEIYYSIDKFIKALKDITKEEKSSITVWFHNLQFDGQFIIQQVKRDTEISKIGPKFQSITLKANKHRIFFKDSYPIVRCSIKKLGKLFGIEKLDSEYKQYLPNSEKVIPDVEKDYLRRDVEILERTVLEIQRNNIDGSQAASYGIREVKRQMAQQTRDKDVKAKLARAEIQELEAGQIVYKGRFGQLGYYNNEQLRQAYRQGFNVLNDKFVGKTLDSQMDTDIIDDTFVKYLISNGVQVEDIENAVEISLDVNSLYLKVLRDYKMPYGGIVDDLYDWDAKRYIYDKQTKDKDSKAIFVDVQIYGRCKSKINPVQDIFEWKDETGFVDAVLPYSEFVMLNNAFENAKHLEYPDDMWWCEAFEQQFVIRSLQIHRVMTFYNSYGMFDSFVNKWYNIKHGKKDFMQLISKSVLTNTVGCIGRKQDISLLDIKAKVVYTDYGVERYLGQAADLHRDEEDKDKIDKYLDEVTKNVKNKEKYVDIIVTDKQDVKIQQLDALAQYVPVPAMVNSIGRCITSWTALNFGDRFIYSDTDQVHVLLSGSFEHMEHPVVRKFDNNKIVSTPAFLSETEIGGFKIERVVQRARFLKKKTYLEEQVDGDQYTVTAGVPDSDTKFSLDGLDGRTKFELGAKYKILEPHQIKGGVGLWESDRTL